MRIHAVTRCASLLAALPLLANAQGQFGVFPNSLSFTTEPDQPVTGPQTLIVDSGKVPFEWAAALGFPNFITLSPSSGLGRTIISVSLNSKVVPYMAPGGYTMILFFESTDPTSPGTGMVNVSLNIGSPKPPAITAVVQSASQQPVVSSFGLVSIYGTNLGTAPAAPAGSYSIPAGAATFTFGRQPTSFDSLATYDGPAYPGGTVVTFNGVPAPLLYISPTQINAVVPAAAAAPAGYDPATGAYFLPVVVTHNGQSSAVFRATFASPSPGIFTVAPNGRGPGAIQNVDAQTGVVTLNSATNPASAGSAVVLYGTGAGSWSQTAPNGTIITDVLTPPYYRIFDPISLTVGGQQAKILYAGAAPGQVFGVFQVNAIVPDGIASGPQPVVLTIHSIDNSQQQVTMFVK